MRLELGLRFPALTPPCAAPAAASPRAESAATAATFMARLRVSPLAVAGAPGATGPGSTSAGEFVPSVMAAAGILPVPVARSLPSSEECKAAVEAAVEAHLSGSVLAALSIKTLRREVEQRLGFPEGGLLAKTVEIKAFASAFVRAQAAAQRVDAP